MPSRTPNPPRLSRASLLVFCLLACSGCENTNLQLAAEAGLEAVQAATLSDREVQQLAQQAALQSDSKNRLAEPDSSHARRLARLIGQDLEADGFRFTCKVYLSPEVNAFAMADGTIRIYSGLMDMLDDDELRFVIGHEMGHVALEHIHKQLRLAYASSAARKAIASVDSAAGDIARSQLGGFVQQLMGAQFSQIEEKEADDYGLKFLKEKGYDPDAAVSALNKLATLGNDHSFLSSHPAPGARAKRLTLQLAGKAASLEEQKQGLLQKSKQLLISAYAKLQSIIQWLGNFL